MARKNWKGQPKTKVDHEEAFGVYVSLGPVRSCRLVAQELSKKYGRSITTAAISYHYKRRSWKKRLEAIRQEALQQVEAHRIETIAEMNARHLEGLAKIYDKALAGLEKADFEDPSDCARTMMSAIRHERDIRWVGVTAEELEQVLGIITSAVVREMTHEEAQRLLDAIDNDLLSAGASRLVVGGSGAGTESGPVLQLQGPDK